MSAKPKYKPRPKPVKRAPNIKQKPKQIQKKSGINWKNIIIVLIIMIITFIAFSPSLKNGFTNWDDPKYIQENVHIKTLTTEKVKRHFSTFTDSNYLPFVLLSFAIEYQFTGMDPSLYHTTNVILHVLNTMFVFLLIYFLSGRRREVAVIVALGFGIHPMHVESVSWITERKDLLYSFFFLISLIFYFKFADVKKNKSVFYALSLIFFIFSLLSKSAAVALSIVIILMDFYLNRKFTTKVILEKIPFIALSIVFGIIAINSQEQAIAKLESLTIFQRLIFASYGFVMYIVKFIAPMNLSAFYPYPVDNFPIKEALPVIYYLTPVFVLGLFTALYFSYKKTRLYIFGILFYFATIALVLQFVTVGKAIMADRYSYIPFIGLFFIVAMLFSKYFYSDKGLLNKLKIPVMAVLIIYGAILGYTTFERTKIWLNTLTLFSDVLKKHPNVDTAYKNRGNYYARVTQEYDKALEDYNNFIALNPNDALIFSNRGNLHGLMGNYEQALEDYSRSAEIDSLKVDTYVNKGVTFIKMNQYSKAIPEFEKAMKIEPDNILIYLNRAYAYLEAGELEKSIKDYEFAILNSVDNSDSYFYKGIANYRLGRFEEALQDNTMAIQINPNSSGAYFNRSNANKQLGNFRNALNDALKAKELGQDVTEAYMEKLRNEVQKEGSFPSTPVTGEASTLPQ